MTSVDQRDQIKVSNDSPAMEPTFSPDGSAVVFVDSSEPPARLLRYEFPSKTLKLMRRAEEAEGYYRLLDWK